jgi:hypothetical protein
VTFQLTEVVPWGRSFDEYVAMFALTPDDLTSNILGCGDGPASFNAELTRRGGRVISADPLYRFSREEIQRRIDEAFPIVVEQTRANAASFVWQHVASVEELVRLRFTAMNEFLADYGSVDARARYVDAALPSLPFALGQFDLALCSHFLFLYSEQHSFQFHIDALMDLCRVAREVRVFPLLELSGRRSRYLDLVGRDLPGRGYELSIRKVPYEFKRGGNEMLVIRGPVKSLRREVS